MAHLREGDRVIVCINENAQTRGNPAIKFNGQEFVIERVREISYGVSGALRGTEYYLEGVVSQYGIPYVFIGEQLIRI